MFLLLIFGDALLFCFIVDDGRLLILILLVLLLLLVLLILELVLLVLILVVIFALILLLLVLSDFGMFLVFDDRSEVCVI